MAKKNKNTQVANSVSTFNAGLWSLIGCGIVMLIVFGIMAGAGAGVVYALTGFNFETFGTTQIAAVAIAAIFVLIGMAWAMIKFLKWETKHTIISNNQLKFSATALQLLGTCFKWLILTVITVGIFGLWLPIKVRQWRVKHTTSTPVAN